MIEVLRTNDPVRLGYAVSLLEEAGCQPFVLDGFISSMEGSISAFQRRVMVVDDEAATARAALKALDAPIVDQAGSGG